MKSLFLLTLASFALLCSSCSQQAEAASTPENIQVSIQGMTCQSCVDSITSAVTNLPGVTACEVSLEQESAKIEFQTGKVSAEQIQQRIHQLGFQASLPE